LSSTSRWRSRLIAPAGISSFIVRLLMLKEPKGSACQAYCSIQAKQPRPRPNLTTSANPAKRVRATAQERLGSFMRSCRTAMRLHFSHSSGLNPIPKAAAGFPRAIEGSTMLTNGGKAVGHVGNTSEGRRGEGRPAFASPLGDQHSDTPIDRAARRGVADGLLVGFVECVLEAAEQLDRVGDPVRGGEAHDGVAVEAALFEQEAVVEVVAIIVVEHRAVVD